MQLRDIYVDSLRVRVSEIFNWLCVSEIKEKKLNEVERI